MKKFKKLSLFIVIAFFIQTLPIQPFLVFADTQAAPTQLAIDGTSDSPGIGYSSTKGNFVKLKWTAPQWTGDTKYYELYCAEDGKTYEKYGDVISSTQTTTEMQKLKSGTVYHVYLKAIHTHYDTNGTLKSKDESNMSNEVVFMTNIELTATPSDNNSLDIKWTDVYYKSIRIAYNLYISESKEFGQTPPIYIGESNIGTSKTVKPVDGKLLYKATALKAGTVYYVKILPLLNDNQVNYVSESEIVSGYTFILGTISRISSDWWKLKWNPITNTSLQEKQEIVYKIKRCTEGDLEKEISATKDTQMYVKVDAVKTYYRIQADIVSQLGKQLSIVSSEVYATETDVPATPSVPDIQDTISYEQMTVGSDSVKVLWRAPATIAGDLDQSIKFDIWMLDDPNNINNDTITPTVSNLPAGPDNYLYNMVGNVKSDKVIGYKYIITGLTPNKTYYLKMVAKKKYLINNGGTLVNKDFSSEPALKEIITPPNGSIDRPVAPAKPPFKVKTILINGKTGQAVTSKTVTLQWKNRWNELWKGTDNKWKYANDNEVQQAVVQGEVYRTINYGSDIKFSVGYEVYTDNFDFSRLTETISSMPMQFTDIPNSTTSDTVEFNVMGLSPNTAYVMWVRAYRSNLLKSGLSDPIIVTTGPDNEIPTEKPAIPTFNYKNPGDTYIEVGWNVVSRYNYTLKYGKTDDISYAEKTIKLISADMKDKTKYKIQSLTPNTAYYFWIMSSIDVSSVSVLGSSDWSDSYSVKTAVYAPPDIPLGFGLKNKTDSVGQHYIYYEWTKSDGLQYTLELATKSDFSNMTSYPVKSVSEYNIQGLISNTRYYARLYAYDSLKDLKSNYTAIVSVMTLKSDEEYNSAVNLDSYTAQKVKPKLDTDGNGTVDVTGTNVDMFVKQIYDYANQDYSINFAALTTKDTTKSQTDLSARVLVALAQMKKTLTLDNGKAALTIKPEILDNEQIKHIYKQNPEFIMDIVLEKPSTSAAKPSGATMVSDQWNVTVTAENGGTNTPITGLKNALKTKIPYSTSTWYDKNTMSGYAYNEQDKTWSKVDTSSAFNQEDSQGFVSSLIPGTCSYAILKWPSSRFTDIGGSAYEADIKAITDKYNTKSLESSNFEPNRNISKAEAVKILLDVMNTSYDDNYMDMASKAKITLSINMTDTNGVVTREQAASMLARVYELITGQKAVSTYSLSGYSDAKTIDPNLLPRVKFAVEKGILKNDWAGVIRPKYSLTRGEMMSMLKNTLVQAGEM